MERTFTLIAVLPLLCSGAAAQTVNVRPLQRLIVQSADSAPAAFLIVNRGGRMSGEPLQFRCIGGRVGPESVECRLAPGEWKAVTAKVTLTDAADSATLTAHVGGSAATVTVVRGLDLTTIPWKRTYQPFGAALDLQRASPDLDDSAWPEIRVPQLWQDLGYAWCRAHVTIPAAWRGRPVRLVIGAVDDNDVSYLNGVEIGRTDGWDVPRSYLLPERLIRWDADSVITVRVENANAGGGLYKAPILLIAGNGNPLARQPAPRPVASRPAPGAVGKPLPLRPFHVDQGVLRYPEGTEVALWGTNYYPQSWYQFENMRRLRVDMKATIRTDLDHLQRMGAQAIRIHVFDREISDGAGNLKPNEHLDLLDYLVSECSRRGIYLYFTPIAWWGGPNERPDSFSAQTSKPGMQFVPRALEAEERYLKQFLTHTNPYDGRAYRDEPCLCLLEVQNEPAYFVYGDLSGSAYTPQGERPEVLARDHAEFARQWRAWLAAHSLTESPANFPLFRYEMMRSYIRRMIAAIRSTGAKQPIAISYFGVDGDDIADAIADSECEATTFSTYPGGWERVNDGTNLLPQMAPLQVDARLSSKARLAYEFDTPATNTSCYLYPAIAAHFRAGEVQVACQFQYDSVSTARCNTDWNAHWLNWLYTPTKAASYMVACEAFRRLPRGIRYPTPRTELKLGPMYCSFAHNISLLVTPDLVMYSRSLPVEAWSTPAVPNPLPANPRRIVGVGNSPYAEYAGTGVYTLESVDSRTLRLTVNPDSRLVGNSLAGSLAAPVAELEYNRHWFRLKLPAWRSAKCYGADGHAVPSVSGGWLLVSGDYRIRR